MLSGRWWQPTTPAMRECSRSAALGEDTDDSDLDLLIDPSPDTTLLDLDIGAIRHELSTLLGVPVDVVTPMALPDTFREAVLAEAVPV